MAIIRKLREKLEITFGKGIRYPISKLNRDLDTIVKHQEENMIAFEEHSIVGETFLRELDIQFEESEALRAKQRLI